MSADGLRSLTRGIARENPVFVTMLGLCPSLAVTTHLVNGYALGMAVLVVLVATNVTVSLLRTTIPTAWRPVAHLAIVALFVTAIDAFLRARTPLLSESLGIFVPLIVANCLVLGRADACARHVPPGRAALDAIGFGIGFTLSLTLIAALREALGEGTLTFSYATGADGLVEIPGLADRPVAILGIGAGALIVIGYLLALLRWIGLKREARTVEEER